MGGINLGAFFQGAVEGYDKGIARQRDQERYDREQKQWAEEDRQLTARKKYETDLLALQKDVREGGGDFASYLRSDITEARKNGLPSPGAEAAKTNNNPLMNMGEGLYRNQEAAYDMYYTKLADITEQFYAVSDPVKATTARETLMTLRDNKFEKTRKDAVAMMLAGDRTGLAAADTAYKLYKDGRNVDTKSGQFDPKTQSWNGVNIVNDKGEVVETRNFTRDDQISILHMSSPEKMVEYFNEMKKIGFLANKDAREAAAHQGEMRLTEAQARKANSEASYYTGAKTGLALDAANRKEAEFIAKQFGTLQYSTGMAPVQRAEIDRLNAATYRKQALWRSVLDTGVTKDGKPISMETALAAATGDIEYDPTTGKARAMTPSGMVVFKAVQ